MISTNIVVGIGFTIWGKPNNRVTVSKKKAIPRDEFGQCRSGFDPRPSTKLRIFRKAAKYGCFAAFYLTVIGVYYGRKSKYSD